MNVTVGGPQTELEAEAKKKLISEKEIKLVLLDINDSKELRKTKNRIRELLSFYERIIKSIDITVKNVKAQTQISYKEKESKYLNYQEKELSTAKAEKSKFRRYLKKVISKLDTLENSN